jgi:integrase/recombinase XerC
LALYPDIQSFLDYLKFEKRYPENTTLAYRTDLEQFYQYLGDEKEGMGMSDPKLAEIASAFIRSWLASLKENKNTAKTINRKISSLKSYFKYHLREESLEKTPMAGIVAPKIPKRLPQYVEQKDISTLFNHVEFPGDWKGRTDRLLLAIFYNTGMRLAELVSLRENQVSLSQKETKNSIKVLGKGNKERVIPVSVELAEMVREYVEEKRRTLENPDTNFLLVNEKGKKLYMKYVYRVVKQYLGDVTTIDKKSPHVLRHTFATHLTNNGADLYAVKELLGHSSLAATQVYTHNTIEKLKDIHKKAHPKA